MSENIASFPDLGAELTKNIIGAALEVHKNLGPGLLESVYESCLFYELKSRGFYVERQLTLPVEYKEIKIEQGLKIDLKVEKKVIVELKTCEKILPIHKAQIITYMRLSRTPLGLLINFNEKMLKNGIQRLVLAEFI